MIKRITQKEADIRIGATIKPITDKALLELGYGDKGEVLMIGNGRFYFRSPDTAVPEMKKFMKEWQASKGEELPSFMFSPEDRA